jgi:hypothetical protein
MKIFELKDMEKLLSNIKVELATAESTGKRKTAINRITDAMKETATLTGLLYFARLQLQNDAKKTRKKK